MRIGIVGTGLLLTSMVGAPSACQEAPVGEAHPSVALPAEVERVLRDYERAWAAGDAAGLARLFTEDGFVAGDVGWLRGRAAITDKYADAGGPLRLRALAWYADGDAGWIVGAYGYGGGEAWDDGGRFILALRRGADGAWLIAADLDRGD